MKIPNEKLVDVVHPICCLQKIAVYETKTRFYLVGSNNSQSRFRILKIDRTEPTEINVIDDKVEYNYNQIRDLLKRIDVGNRPKASKSYDKGPGMVHRGYAFGILGFIKFLEGYYLVLISKRRRVAVIGGHAIYKIDDTDILPIGSKVVNPDETKYLRIFQNVDLSSNFYFSCSYDLTRTLQYNLAPYYGLPPKFCDHHKVYEKQPETKNQPRDFHTMEELVEDSKDLDLDSIFNFNKIPIHSNNVELSSLSANMFPDIGSPPNEHVHKCKQQGKIFRGEATEKYVWNSYLLKDLKEHVHPDWLLHITHGFVGQSNISVYGKPLYVTLIARRSNKFAGTRFLKRGTNDQGFVANDVETEQICHDAATLSLQSGRYTSYVQMRGSAPFFWSQDTIQGRITPKPQILVDRADPFFTSTAQHFNSLISRYGTPVVILNLVKIREKKPHEQILSGLLKDSIEYLNQFLPPEHIMQYIAWDMARVTKSKEDKVIEILAEIAERVMKETGFFHSGPQLFCNKLRNDPSFQGMKGFGYNDSHFGLKQTGILRVNCVDCLDRTNTAQFMVGKCALGFQLHALGVIESPVLKFDTDAVRILEELFEAHGDTLALQYGGSQMVHRIRTYRKIAPWTSYSRDIMQTVSRYYSNAFTDMDKQQAINLFLGTFVPDEKSPNIWDIPTDYYLHHTSTLNINIKSTRQSYTKWLEEDVLSALPFSWEEVAKKKMIENLPHDKFEDEEEDEEVVDVFAEYYRPSELTELDSLYPRTMPTSTKDFMPTSSCDPSPFVVRLHGRAEDDLQVGHRPIGGQPGLEESSDEGSSSDDEKIGGPFSPTKAISRDILAPVDFNLDNWPTFTRLYGINVSEPIPEDRELYQRYADISHTSTPFRGHRGLNSNITWDVKSEFDTDSSIQVKQPTVDEASRKIYENYCQIGIVGPSQPAKINADIYSDYVGKKYL